MNFRLKAFGMHLLASTAVLSLTIGTLYLGWYHWPGWYLADVLHVLAILVGADLVPGPTLTLIIANVKKPLRELARDIAIIVAFQLSALVYGSSALWAGRPLYYAFSEDCLQVVQANDIDPGELALARRQHSQFVPRWYSVPRWVWAPLPEDPKERENIVSSAIQGGFDVIGMPRYFKPWEQGLPTLRTQLKNVDDIRYFSAAEKKRLKQRMQAAGFATDQRNAMPLTGRLRPLLAVFDPASLRITAIFKAT